MQTELTNKRCAVCRGMIVERIEVYWPPPLTYPPTPPAFDDMRTRRLGYHCSGCGIEYYKLP